LWISARGSLVSKIRSATLPFSMVPRSFERNALAIRLCSRQPRRDRGVCRKATRHTLNQDRPMLKVSLQRVLRNRLALGARQTPVLTRLGLLGILQRKWSSLVLIGKRYRMGQRDSRICRRHHSRRTRNREESRWASAGRSGSPGISPVFGRISHR
jgi:hypothetical protein